MLMRMEVVMIRMLLVGKMALMVMRRSSDGAGTVAHH